MRVYQRVPPEGGFGWVIVFANALSNFLVISLLPCFGLLFTDTFNALGLSATQQSLIITANAAFGSMMGPLTGVLLKVCGCRKAGLLGAFLFTSGMVLTSLSRNFSGFLIGYGVVTSLGMQTCEATYRLALSMYFKKRRCIAMGFAVTAAGFGPILVPQFIRLLMKSYSAHQATLIYAGVCAHMFVAAILLQPVEWHMREELVDQRPERTQLLVEEQDKKLVKQAKQNDKNALFGRFVTNVANIFDLDLLKDPIFDNILVGIALSTFAELNFTILTPFILRDFQLNTDQVAIFLSTLGVADIIFRFYGPYIGNYFKKPSRLMYAYSLVILMIIRFGLLFSYNFYVLLAVAFAWGLAKGVRKVYMWLVIPDYVAVEKLASAGGIETLANGICILIGGPIMGALRDATGSYVICIVSMNCVTITAILLWIVEALFVRYKKKARQ